MDNISPNSLRGNLNDQLVACADAGNLAGIERLLAQGAAAGAAGRADFPSYACNPKAENSMALRMAAKKGHHECVKRLIPVSNPANCFSALAAAASWGRLECVALLLPFSDASADFSSALFLAISGGHIDCARALIPALGPKDSFNSLSFAAFHGHVEGVTLLTPISDAEARSCALRRAAARGKDECVKLLLPVSGPLGDMLGLADDVAYLGLASTFSIIIDHEPLLLNLLDLPSLLGAAVAKHHSELVRLLSSLAERQSLSGHLSPPTPPGGSTAPRL